MLVVSDTSPLSNLAFVGRLDLLRGQFAQIYMPPAVARELDAITDPGVRHTLAKAISDRWIREISLPSSAPLPPQIHGLDAGEAEALRLALAISADYVLIDEREGRQCAAELGLHVIGVLGVLLNAKRSGAIPSLRSEIEMLRREAGFFIDRVLEARLLAMAAE